MTRRTAAGTHYLGQAVEGGVAANRGRELSTLALGRVVRDAVREAVGPPPVRRDLPLPERRPGMLPQAEARSLYRRALAWLGPAFLTAALGRNLPPLYRAPAPDAPAGAIVLPKATAGRDRLLARAVVGHLNGFGANAAATAEAWARAALPHLPPLRVEAGRELARGRWADPYAGWGPDAFLAVVQAALVGGADTALGLAWQVNPDQLGVALAWLLEVPMMNDEKIRYLPPALIEALVEAIEARDLGPPWWHPRDGVEVAETAHGVRIGGHLPTVEELRRTPVPDRAWVYYSRVMDAYGLRVGGRGRWLVH